MSEGCIATPVKRARVHPVKRHNPPGSPPSSPITNPKRVRPPTQQYLNDSTDGESDVEDDSLEDHRNTTPGGESNLINSSPPGGECTHASSSPPRGEWSCTISSPHVGECSHTNEVALSEDTPEPMAALVVTQERRPGKRGRPRGRKVVKNESLEKVVYMESCTVVPATEHDLMVPVEAKGEMSVEHNANKQEVKEEEVKEEVKEEQMNEPCLSELTASPDQSLAAGGQREVCTDQSLAAGGQREVCTDQSLAAGGQREVCTDQSLAAGGQREVCTDLPTPRRQRRKTAAVDNTPREPYRLRQGGKVKDASEESPALYGEGSSAPSSHVEGEGHLLKHFLGVYGVVGIYWSSGDLLE